MGMNFGDFFLGTKSEADFRSFPTKSPEQLAELNKLLAMLGGEIGDFNMNPALTDREQTMDDQLASLFGGDLFEIMGNTYKDALQYDPQDIDEYFTQTVQDPLLRDFKTDILPGISARAGSNFWGSDRVKQDREATNDLTSTLGRERTRMSFDADQQARNRMLQALGLGPTVAEGFRSMHDTSDLSETKRRRALEERMQLINALLGATGQQTIENIGIAKPGQTGAGAYFLQGLGEGLGSMAGGA